MMMMMRRISDQTAAFAIHRISRLVLYNRGGECLQRGTHLVLIKVATTCTEDGDKQTTKTSTTISTERTKKHRKTEEEMEGPISS